MSEQLTHTRLTGARFLVILAELALVLFAAYSLHIEERHSFQLVLPLIFVGFAIHAWLPPGLRPAFFLAVSIASILLVLGAVDGLELLAAGGVLFGLAHLPGRWRIGALLAAGVVLAMARVEWIPLNVASYFGTGALPLLAAMFMFRLIVYVHDLPHEQKPVPLSQRLAYFFMVPNVCFPLFPVIDYRNFVREYYSGPAAETYQKGLRWMMRGIVHLLFYRLVYYQFMPSFQDVTDLSGVVQYVVSSYLLYLRVSGMFHLVVGILCLFGYNLSESHRLYFLASSFTDFWRRINIYWKDFAMKILYYPLFMRLRRLGVAQAVMFASLAVLICSWMLHSYQTFWLQGVFPLTVQDAVFWSVLGVAVAINSVLELRRGRARAGSTDKRTVRAALSLSVKTVAMFCFMAVLWSFWSTNSVDEWLAIFAVARDASLRELLLLAASLAGLVAIGTGVQLILHRGWVLSSEKQASFGRTALMTTAMAAAAILFSTARFGGRLGTDAYNVWASLTSIGVLNVRDREIETRGYYEDLLGAEVGRQAAWTMQGAPLVKRYFSIIGIAGLAEAVQGTDDIRKYELKPSLELSYKGAAFHTNRFGMRDQDYERVKRPGTCRILLFGDSHTMGSGVPDDDTYEAVTERRLNSERPVRSCDSFEILNFGVAGYTALQSAVLARKRIPEFDPDVVIYATPQPDLEWTVSGLAEALVEGARVDEPFVRDMIDTVNFKSGMSEFAVRQLLMPVREPLVRWAYGTIVEAAAKQGARAAWLFLPRFDIGAGEEQERYDKLAPLAQETGFTALSLAGAYDGVATGTLQIAPWDKHPNARANALLADRLYQVLMDNWRPLSPPGENTRGQDDATR